MESTPTGALNAGVTAGIDLALAIVEQDLGLEIALKVARELVVFLKRPGGQTQFSTFLAGHVAQKTPIRVAQDFIADNLATDLMVGAVANRVGMSDRFFKAVQGRGRDDACRLRREHEARGRAAIG